MECTQSEAAHEGPPPLHNSALAVLICKSGLWVFGVLTTLPDQFFVDCRHWCVWTVYIVPRFLAICLHTLGLLGNPFPPLGLLRPISHPLIPHSIQQSTSIYLDVYASGLPLVLLHLSFSVVQHQPLSCHPPSEFHGWTEVD
jgi:hypothetical protein